MSGPRDHHQTVRREGQARVVWRCAFGREAGFAPAIIGQPGRLQRAGDRSAFRVVWTILGKRSSKNHEVLTESGTPSAT